MKKSAGLSIIFIVVFIYGMVWAGGMPEDLQPRPALPMGGQADKVYMASDWVLNIYFTQKGTRSQGSHGRLFFKGKEVGGKMGQTKDLPIGIVTYKGPAHAKANLWDASGWQMTDPLVEPLIHFPPPDSGNSRPDMQKLETDFNNAASKEE